MLYDILKSKINGARITGCNINYVGSITIDKSLMDAAGIVPNEKVIVGNFNNGNRFTTYAIPGEKGVIGVNGPASNLAKVGDKLIVLCFCMLSEEELKEHEPKIIFVDEENNITQKL